MASASSEAGSTRSQEIEELERFIDSYVLEYQVQGLLGDKADGDLDLDNGGKVPQVRALSFKRTRICVAAVVFCLHLPNSAAACIKQPPLLLLLCGCVYTN